MLSDKQRDAEELEHCPEKNEAVEQFMESEFIRYVGFFQYIEDRSDGV